MARKSVKPPYRKLAVSLLLSALILILAVAGSERLQWQSLPERLILPLLRLHLFILIGLAAGQTIEMMGWTRSLAALARPLFRFSRLGDRCGASFTAAWFSGVAANAMLYDFYRDGTINRRQLYLTNLVNQLPSYFLHLPTTVFIVLPLTGIAGALYFLLTFLAAVLRTAVFLVLGRLMLPKQPQTAAPGETPKRTRGESAAGLIDRLRDKLPARMTGVALYVIPIYVAVYVIHGAGGFDMLREAMTRTVVTSVIPMESLSVVVLSFAAEFTSGFAAAGALMDAGVLSVKQTVIALIIGNVLAFPVRALRHQLPRYVGIFKPKMGTQILLAGQGARVVSLLTVAAVYFLVA
ncbi:MAG: nucleoside recognition protein [Desulfobacterales bacterium]|jgi:hypothetical protein